MAAYPKPSIPPPRERLNLLQRSSLRTALVGLSVFAAVAAYLAALHLPLIDDSYIMLAYARTLATSGTWGMYPGHVGNAVTSPLDVILTAIVGRVVGSYTAAVIWLSAAELAVAFLACRSIASRLKLPAFPVLALVALAANPLLLSTLGLESVLFAALLIAGFAAWMAERDLLLGIIFGLLILARPDGALFAWMIGGMLALQGRLRSSTINAAVLVVAPWLAYSWVHLGSMLPDSFFLKTLERSWGGQEFGPGLKLYYAAYPLATLGSFVLAPFGFIAVRDSRLRQLLIGFAELHFFAYTILGVPPYHWYYVPEVVSLTIAGALYVAEVSARHGRQFFFAAIAVPVCILAMLMIHAGFPPQEPFIHTNWATASRYEEVARDLNAHTAAGQPILFFGEIGTLAFYSHSELVDIFSDPSVLPFALNQQGLGSPLRRFLLDVNFTFRSLRSSYGKPQLIMMHQIADPADGRYPPKPEGATLSWKTSTKWRPYGRISLIPRPCSSAACRYDFHQTEERTPKEMEKLRQ